MFATVFTKRHPKVGAKPGTLVIPEQSPAPRIRVISYGAMALSTNRVELPIWASCLRLLRSIR